MWQIYYVLSQIRRWRYARRIHALALDRLRNRHEWREENNGVGALDPDTGLVILFERYINGNSILKLRIPLMMPQLGEFHADTRSLMDSSFSNNDLYKVLQLLTESTPTMATYKYDPIKQRFGELITGPVRTH